MTKNDQRVLSPDFKELVDTEASQIISAGQVLDLLNKYVCGKGSVRGNLLDTHFL